MTLSDAMTAARAGRREEARALLMRVLETDERNVQAWLWLSGVVDDPEQMRICLSNVLHLEPTNPHALKGMAIFEQKYGKLQASGVGARSADSVMDILTRYGPSPVFAPAAPASGAVPMPASTEPGGQATTGPTVPLAPSPDDPPVSAASTSDPTIGLGPAPCPCCGYNAPLNRTHCPQCHKSMLLFTLPDHLKGSRALTILALLWALPTIIGAVIIFVLFLGNIINTATTYGTSGILMVIMLICLAIVFFAVSGLFLFPWIFFWKKLYQKRPWAYILAAIGVGLTTLWNVVALIVMLCALANIPRAEWMNIFYRSQMSEMENVLLYTFAFLWSGVQIFLLVKGYPDVFGKYRRVPYIVTKTASDVHYNYGLDMKEKGMWYAAMLEWEAAVYTSPKDTHYLHALALAQAQLKLRGKALSTMRQALALEPSNGSLQETFRLIQQGQI